MKKSFLTLLMLLASVLTASAQILPVVFQKLTWKQAAEKAEKQGKIIVVDVMMKGGSTQFQEQQEKTLRTVFNNSEISKFCKENAVVIQMDMLSKEGEAFAPKMAMFMYPAYAFFMPNGDILGVTNPTEAEKDAQKFIKTGEEALQAAKVKRANSRSITFQNLSYNDALTKAKQEKKLVFIDAYTSWCQPCLLMLKNVFTIDKVADFYNEKFINLKIDFGQEKELCDKFGVKGFPAFLFVNGDGKLVHMEGGYTPSDKFIGYGKKALKTAKGIDFIEGTWNQALDVARKENKLIFVDCYTSWCGPCKKLAKTVFTNPEVGKFFNEKFVSIKLNMEKPEGKDFKKMFTVSAYPTMFFINAKGEMVHTLVGGVDAKTLIEQANKALNSTGMAYMNAKYEKGERNPEFIKEYLVMLSDANQGKKAEAVCKEYLNTLDKSLLKEKVYWDLFMKYVNDVHSDLFMYVYNNRAEFCSLFGDKIVKDKIETVWAIGANAYVQGRGEEVTFDEKGFKKYVKRLAKTDIENRFEIIDNAKMHIAESLGNWKEYIALGTKQLKKRKVSDMYLFNWGLRIDQQCKDSALRLKAAKWFDDAVERCKKEEAAGTPSMFSYRTNFEDLAKKLKVNK